MSERFFNWLLKLYPRRFRGEYGDAMRQLFRDRLREETGFTSRARLAFDILLDLAISLPREHARPDSASPVEPGRYRLSEQAIDRMARLRHSRQFWTALGGILICYAVAWVGGAPRLPLAVLYAVVIAAAMMSMLRQSLRFKQMMRGYLLELSGDEIRQTADRPAPRSLHRNEIEKMTEYSFGIMLSAKEAAKSIWIPSAITGYEDLKGRLIAWAPLEKAFEGPLINVRSFALLSMVGLLPAALLVRSAYAAIPLIALTAIPLGFLTCAAIGERAAHPRSFKVVWLLPVVFAALLVWKAFTLLR